MNSADTSIKAYDEYVFASVGRSFDANKADALAAVAYVDCETASRDRKVNQVTRDHYRALAAQFKGIL